MRESEKRSLKLLVGIIGMAPLTAGLFLILFPEAFPNIQEWKRIFLVGFIMFSYCFGLTKWCFPNG